MLEIAASSYKVSSSPARDGAFPAFPIPMGGKLSFSYGGLLSAVQRHISTLNPAHLETILDSNDEYEFHPSVVSTAAAFQHAAVLQLEKKTGLALDLCEKKGVDVKRVVVSGGVGSNGHLRAR